jgi:hypothetical protein
LVGEKGKQITRFMKAARRIAIFKSGERRAPRLLSIDQPILAYQPCKGWAASRAYRGSRWLSHKVRQHQIQQLRMVFTAAAARF